MKSDKINIALLVHSCDRYEFLFKGFDHFFSRYWDFNINCNYYFATEEKDAVINGFTTIRSGKGEWADRLAFLLNENIKEDYILYFQEDMWLNKKVNADFFKQLFDLAIRNNWEQVKLHSSEVYRTKSTGHFIEGFNVAEIDNIASDFLMSHQVTLWKKDFLIAQLFKKEHPWRNERKGTRRLKKLNPLILHVDYFAENGYKEINANLNPIERSEYHAISINSMLNTNIVPYIADLKSDSDLQPYAKELEHHFYNNLTHDGNPKPRKEDLFKTIRIYFTLLFSSRLLF